MTEYQTWYQAQQVERTIKALGKNNFDARFVPRAADAAAAVFEMIPDGSLVGVGGSMTRVLPVPAPAITSTGPSMCVTASY